MKTLRFNLERGISGKGEWLGPITEEGWLRAFRLKTDYTDNHTFVFDLTDKHKEILFRAVLPPGQKILDLMSTDEQVTLGGRCWLHLSNFVRPCASNFLVMSIELGIEPMWGWNDDPLALDLGRVAL